jgi:hypothetical protein
MSYAGVDAEILTWAKRHSLTLFTSDGDREARFAYVSSKAGDCFQISIAPPTEGAVELHAFGVTGQWLNDPEQHWKVPISNLKAAMEEAFGAVLGWMMPSERYFPPTRSRACRAAKWMKGILR